MFPLTFIDLIVCALAANQIVEIWRHSILFQRIRYDLQVAQLEVKMTPAWYSGIVDWFTYLLLCNWCLSVWVALIAIILVTVGNDAARIVAMAFAISRLANLINDLSYDWLRTPKYDAGVMATPPPVPSPFPFDLKKEQAAMLAEHEMNVQRDIECWGSPETKSTNRETTDPDPETTTPLDETNTGRSEIPVSAKTNDQTQTKPPPPPPSEYR